MSKGKNEEQEGNLLLAMPLFNNNESYDIAKVLDNLKNYWKLDVMEIEEVSNETAVFNINGLMVAIAKMPAPVPMEEIENAAPYNYAWGTAVNDLKSHTGHAIVTVLDSNTPMIERYTVFSKMLCSILTTSNCVGIYQGAQTLLLQKDYYLEFVEELQNNEIPVPLWVYVGVRKDDDGLSIYTYGLEAFNKMEMEIINSKVDFDDLYDLMLNIISYVISGDVTFRNGETIGYTATQKILLKISKGIYLQGQETIKLKV